MTRSFKNFVFSNFQKQVILGEENVGWEVLNYLIELY